MEAQDRLLVESMAPLSSNKQKEEGWGTFLVDSNHSLRQLSLYCRGPWITIWIGVPIRISLFRPRRQDDWGLFSYTHASYPLQDHHKEWNLMPLSPKGKTSCIHRSYSPFGWWTGKPLLSLSSGQVVKQKNALPSITRVSERLLSVQSRTITTRIWAVSF
jgi:hypothetical protein